MFESNGREARNRTRHPAALAAEPPAGKVAVAPIAGVAVLGILALLAAPACSLVVGSDGEPCTDDADCGPDQRCQNGECVPDSAEPSCDDGRQNGAETDVDCGGPECARCADGADCNANSDCLSGLCESGTCAAGGGPTCDDGEQNQAETDVDCGGPACPACADGRSCASDGDCQSGFCDAGTCAQPPGHCTNDTRDADETDVDCGGADCPGCADGQACDDDGDCQSDYCQGGTCQPAGPSCDDGEQNGAETDVDCGGPDCPACADDQGCEDDSDCLSDNCQLGACQPAGGPGCSDGEQNGDETDVDCGGPDCPACPLAAGCLGDADCQSGLCQQDSCALSRGQPMPGDGDPVDALAVDIQRETVPAFAGDYLIATGADDRYPRLFRFSASSDGAITQLGVDLNHISGPIIQVAFQRAGLNGQDYLFSINSARGIKRWYPYDADSPHVIFHNLSGAVFATTPEDGRWVAGGHIGVLGTEAAVIWDGTGSGGSPCTTDTPSACEAIVYMDADTTITSLAFSPRLTLGMSTPTLLAAGSDDAGVLDAGLRLWSSSDWVGWEGGAGGVDPLVTLEPDNQVHGLAFHPAPQTPLLAALIETPAGERAVHIYDVSDWQNPPADPQPAVVALEAGVRATALAFAPDAADPALLVATDSGFVSAVCDTGDGWQLRYSAEVQAPAGILDLAVADDGRWLVSGESDAFRIWHLPSLLALLGCPQS